MRETPRTVFTARGEKKTSIRGERTKTTELAALLRSTLAECRMLSLRPGLSDVFDCFARSAREKSLRWLVSEDFMGFNFSLQDCRLHLAWKNIEISRIWRLIVAIVVAFLTALRRHFTLRNVFPSDLLHQSFSGKHCSAPASGACGEQSKDIQIATDIICVAADQLHFAEAPISARCAARDDNRKVFRMADSMGR